MPSLERIKYLALFALCCSLFFVVSAQAQNKDNGKTAEVKGKVSICKEIDDDWKCVGQSNDWKADAPFNILFENQKPVGVDFIGIIFYKQGTDGKDAEFINELQADIGEKNSKYATVGDSLKLPAGIYSVYIITWGKRELMMKNGNFTEYLAKMVLTVK
jgi:hypothetical protein